MTPPYTTLQKRHLYRIGIIAGFISILEIVITASITWGWAIGLVISMTTIGTISTAYWYNERDHDLAKYQEKWSKKLKEEEE